MSPLQSWQTRRDGIIFLIVVVSFGVGIVSAFVAGLVGLGPEIGPESYNSLLTTNATFIATILAVSFSISIFIIQHGASNYVPSLLDMYLKDRATWTAFSLLSLAAVVNLFGLAIDPQKAVSNTAFFLSAHSFGLLAYQFYNTTRMVSPSNLIQAVENKARRYVRTLTKKVQEIAGKEIKENTKLATVLGEGGTAFYNQVVFHRPDLHRPTLDMIRSIIDIVQKAIVKREIETAQIGLRSVCNIVKEYTEIRSNDITPDDKFISAVYEQLKSLSITAFDNRDTFTLNALSSAFRDIGVSTVKIPLIGGMQDSHESTNMSIYYLKEMALISIEKELFDAAAEGIRALRTVGLNAIQGHNGDALAISSVSEIGVKASLKGDWYVPRQAFEALSMLVYAYINEDGNPHRVGTDLQYVTKAISMAIVKLGSNAELALLPFFGPRSRTRFEYSCTMMVGRALQVKRGDFPPIETHGREEFVQIVIEDIVEMMQSVSSFAIKTKNLGLIGDIAACLAEISEICLREKFVTLPEGLSEPIQRTISSLVGLHSAVTNTHSIYESEISDSLTLLAFEAINQANKEIALDILKMLLNMSINIAKTNKYEAVRLSNKILMVGVYAADKDNIDVAKEAARNLQEYDKKVVDIVKEPEERMDPQSLKKSVEQVDKSVEFRKTPKLFLKENLSAEVWNKYDKLTK